MASVSSLIDQWIADNGAPRRFEPEVSGSFEYFNCYLHRFGIRLRMQGWRCHYSQNGAQWRPIPRRRVRKLVDELRKLEGLEPLRAVRK